MLIICQSFIHRSLHISVYYLNCFSFSSYSYPTWSNVVFTSLKSRSKRPQRSSSESYSLSRNSIFMLDSSMMGSCGNLSICVCIWCSVIVLLDKHLEDFVCKGMTNCWKDHRKYLLNHQRHILLANVLLNDYPKIHGQVSKDAWPNILRQW